MTTYRLRSGARFFYMGMGAFSGGFGLLMLWAASMRWYDMGPDEVFLASVGCLFLLLGVWCFYGVRVGHVEFQSRHFVISGAFGTTRLRYDEVAGLGFFRVPIHGARWTAHMTRKQHDGGMVVHFWIKTGPKKAKHITASMYDSSRKLMRELETRTGTPLEEMPRGELRGWLKRNLS